MTRESSASVSRRLLHGSPASILPGPVGGGPPAPYERVTFCVNIWVGHKPRRCTPFQPPPIGGGAGWPDFRLRQPTCLAAADALKAPHASLHLHAGPRTAAAAAATTRGAGEAKGRLGGGAEEARVCSFGLAQTDVPHTLSLTLPSAATLRRTLRDARVLTLHSSSNSLHPSSASSAGPCEGGADVEADGADARADGSAGNAKHSVSPGAKPGSRKRTKR